MVYLSLGCQMGQQEGVHLQIPHLSPPLQIPHLSQSRRVWGYLRVPLLTSRAPRSSTCSQGWRRDCCTGNVYWISCCTGVQPKVLPIDNMHLRMIVCTFLTKTAIYDGDACGPCITTEAMSSTSYNMDV
ncbi:hypothetical protein M9H77_04181 [Catharanthus roseus]|uniref:Uncharacterized protein n=1 Tax=Catharanthus roseus TaxID=4058 RepID=A0ACC0CDS3_CATRO|nr:hypothetical protein M9H77_04181 [Catharanthus roseus]